MTIRQNMASTYPFSAGDIIASVWANDVNETLDDKLSKTASPQTAFGVLYFNNVTRYGDKLIVGDIGWREGDTGGAFTDANEHMTNMFAETTTQALSSINVNALDTWFEVTSPLTNQHVSVNDDGSGDIHIVQFTVADASNLGIALNISKDGGTLDKSVDSSSSFGNGVHILTHDTAYTPIMSDNGETLSYQLRLWSGSATITVISTIDAPYYKQGYPINGWEPDRDVWT